MSREYAGHKDSVVATDTLSSHLSAVTQSTTRSVAENSTTFKSAARELEWQLQVSARCHFNRAAFWDTVHNWLGLPGAVFSTLASLGAAISALADNKVFTVAFAVVAAVLTATTTFLGASDKSRLHLEAGRKYRSLAERIKLFRIQIDPTTGVATPDAMNEYSRFLDDQEEIDKCAPHAPPRVYKRVKKEVPL